MTAATLAVLAGIAIGAAADAPRQDAARFRTLLPTGAAILVENMPAAKTVSLQLFASAKGVAESPASHGWRHLLEHLLEKGPDKNLPFRLESMGMFLTADTHRDAMQFTITAPPDRLDDALAAISDLLKPLQTTDAEIRRETKVLGEEMALATVSKRLSKVAWLRLYGELGLDPLGDLSVIAKATPASLELLRRRHFATQNLVVSLCGPVDVDATTKRIRDLLPKEKSPVEPESMLRQPASASPPSSTVEVGDVLAAVAPGWAEPESAARLAAALALASEREDCFVVYTPSVQPGAISIGTAQPNADLVGWLAKKPRAEIDGLFSRGRTMAEDWLWSQLATPEGSANLRGFLMAQNLSATPEDFLANIKKMTPAEFRAAAGAFK